MKEDRDTRDPDSGPHTSRRTKADMEVASDVWARAAEQALRDMARARAHARERSTPDSSVR